MALNWSNWSRDINQQLLDQTFGVGKVQAGGGRGEQALSRATPQQRAQYLAARRQYQPNYNFVEPYQFEGGVSSVGVVEPFNPFQKEALQTMAGGYQANLPDSQEYFDAAQSGLAGSTPITAENFDSRVGTFFSPYREQVADYAADELASEYDKAIGGFQSAEAGTGSFGNTASAVRRAALESDKAKDVAGVRANYAYQGFGDAIRNAFANSQQGLNTANTAFGLGMTAENAGYNNFYNNAQYKLNAGDRMQQQNQRQVDVTASEMSRARDYPYERLDRLTTRFNPFLTTGNSIGAGTGQTALGRFGNTVAGLGIYGNQRNWF